MGLFDYVNKAIDTVITTVKQVVSPQSAQETSSKKETIEMVSQETMAKEKNEDTVNIKTRSVDFIYNQIGELCEDYRMSKEDVRKAQLLEKIAGCSSEELAKKSDAEIKSYIDSLKFVLKWQSWKLPWNDRNINDIENIAKKANDRCIYLQSGGNFLGNIFRKHETLSERLNNAGYEEVTAQNVQAFFEKKITEAVATKNPKKIQKAYDKALKTYGEILIDTKDSQEKALLVAAIEHLEAGKRNLAVQMSISSCGINSEEKSVVAKGINDNYRAITCKVDALGNYTTDTDNLEISKTSFQYMSEEDSLVALAENKAYAKSLAEKVQNGEELTPEEQRFLNSVNVSYYAGATVGAACNTVYSNKDTVLSTIDNDTAEQGIQSQVYTAANNYVNEHKDSLTITQKAFTQAIDKATNGNYSSVLSGSKDNNESKTQVSNKNKQQISTKSKGVNSDISRKTSNENSSEINFPIEENRSESNEKSNNSSSSGNNLRKNTPNNNANKVNSTVSNPTKKQVETKKQPNNTPAATTQNVAIQGGVKQIKQFAKENNVSTFELAIDTLNATTVNSATRKWALNQFKLASNSEQIINFNKITHTTSALAAAKSMDDEIRSQLNTFRSYYIKEAVENIEKA